MLDLNFSDILPKKIYHQLKHKTGYRTKGNIKLSIWSVKASINAARVIPIKTVGVLVMETTPEERRKKTSFMTTVFVV